MHHSPPEYRHLKKLALWPVILMACATLVLSIASPPRIYSLPLLSSTLTLVFQSILPVATAAFASVTYIRTGIPVFLIFGGGFLVYGLGCTLILFDFLHAFQHEPNISVTIHNTTIFLTSLACAASVILTIKADVPVVDARPRRWASLAFTYLGLALLTLLIAYGANQGALPPFFVQGAGPTPLREVILLCTIVLLAFTSSMSLLSHLRTGYAFPYWFGLGILLFMIGIFGIFFQTSLGSPLNWISRCAQYLGAAYFLFAILAARQDAQRIGKMMSDVLEDLITAERRREQAEERLRFNEERLRLATDTANLGYFDWNIRTGDTYLSPLWKKQLGYADDEVPNRFQEFEDRLHPDERQRVLTHVNDYLRRPYPGYELEFRLRHRDGSYRTIYTRSELLMDESGAPLRMIGTHMDITERKLMEVRLIEAAEAARRKAEEIHQREQEFRALAENAPDIIARYDREHRYLYVNPAISRLKGLEPKDLIGKRVGCRMNMQQRQCLEQAIELVFGSGKEHISEWIYETQAGAKFYQARFTPEFSMSGEISSVLEIARDVTELKTMAADLRSAKEAAEAASRAKSEFLANMSHEIRTPMNGILGMTLLALKRELPPDVREYLQLVQQSGNSLLDIINDILDLSKIEAGKVVLNNQPFDLLETIESTLKPAEITARVKGLRFSFSHSPDIPAKVQGDSGRLRQVLNNIVGNAIKFTPRGSVTVTLGLANTTDTLRTRLQFVVADEGIGIPPDRLEAIFDSFEQLHSSAHIKYGGSGLGLAIAKRLVEMMNGAIWVTSEPGRGSTFSFTVELERVHEEEAPPADACRLPEPSPALRILLAEDNPVSSLFACRLLEDWGHSVDVVEDGRQAIERLRAASYDLVLMDALMPEMSGEEATQLIRSGQAGNPNVPIIALTAFALQGDRERFLAAGMDDYISKPLDMDEFAQMLRRVIGCD
ncbi:ATP-binding protein [Fundidesulfovibrio agrisoli]|uniref:ATP-binding protein n=1 Tax=Fundidesulfovibrio agrisoli TaxID=2922717 RepID=UPI001FAC331D|nr:ATP-binding protein [Fundidesulfovibrio agrisoli]